MAMDLHGSSEDAMVKVNITSSLHAESKFTLSNIFLSSHDPFKAVSTRGTYLETRSMTLQKGNGRVVS